MTPIDKPTHSARDAIGEVVSLDDEEAIVALHNTVELGQLVYVLPPDNCQDLSHTTLLRRAHQAMKAAWVEGYSFVGVEGFSETQTKFQEVMDDLEKVLK